jgi:hypothetical protein
LYVEKRYFGVWDILAYEKRWWSMGRDILEYGIYWYICGEEVVGMIFRSENVV